MYLCSKSLASSISILSIFLFDDFLDGDLVNLSIFFSALPIFISDPADIVSNGRFYQPNIYIIDGNNYCSNINRINTGYRAG